jgi:hypothetical protein
MSKPADEAKKLGLEYCGFGGWCIPKTREVVARTVDGQLVRVDDNEDQKKNKDLGRLIVVNFDDELLYVDSKHPEDRATKLLVNLMKSVVRTGSDVILLHARNSEKKVAKWLKMQGITGGPTLIPYGSADVVKKKELIEKKIRAGYKEIEFFDSDAKSLRAINSLKAPFNKRQIQIDTHQIPKLAHDPSTRPEERPESAKDD